MLAFLIIAGLIGWIFIGLRSIVWMINTIAKIHGYCGEEPEVRFTDFFKIRCREDFVFFLGLSVVAIFWFIPAIIIIVARKIYEKTKDNGVRYTGVLSRYKAPETEWVTHWNLLEDGKIGFDARVPIEAGDHLKVFTEDGLVLFDDIINPDYRAGWTELLSGYGAPRALGRSVCWTQRGWEPDDWAKLFFRADDKRLRAELIKKA